MNTLSGLHLTQLQETVEQQADEIERLKRRFNEVCDLLDRAEGNIVRQEQEIERLRAALTEMVDRWEPDAGGRDRIMWENAREALSIRQTIKEKHQMSDIVVERLRFMEHSMGLVLAPVCKEAADEIERLLAALQAITAVDNYDGQGFAAAELIARRALEPES